MSSCIKYHTSRQKNRHWSVFEHPNIHLHEATITFSQFYNSNKWGKRHVCTWTSAAKGKASRSSFTYFGRGWMRTAGRSARASWSSVFSRCVAALQSHSASIIAIQKQNAQKFRRANGVMMMRMMRARTCRHRARVCLARGSRDSLLHQSLPHTSALLFSSLTGDRG